MSSRAATPTAAGQVLTERARRARRAPPRATLLLAAGATVGLALAAAQIVGSGARLARPPAGAIATVNDVPLQRKDYECALAALSVDRRDSLAEADRRRVLDRLIEEELLLQRGVDLGLVRRDGRVRADLVAAMIDAIASEASAREPTDDEVARFYDENRDLFTRPGRLRLRQLVVRVTPAVPEGEARRRAEAAAARLRAGEDFAVVAAELGDAEPAPLPDGLLPPAKLREYLGPTAARAALELPVSQVSDPVRSAAGYHVLQALERDTTSIPPLADIGPQVRAELKRQNGDRALRDYLDALRARARIVVAEPDE